MALVGECPPSGNLRSIGGAPRSRPLVRGGGAGLGQLETRRGRGAPLALVLPRPHVASG
jgi:hypothetical protein